MTGQQPNDLVAEDVICTDCGKRSRDEFAPPTEPCWAGGSTDSAHDWRRVEASHDTDHRRLPRGDGRSQQSQDTAIDRNGGSP